jgi:hypothetical protein
VRCRLPLERAERICAALREWPAQEPLTDVLPHLFAQEYASRDRPPDETLRAAVRHAASNAGMAGAIDRAMPATEAPLAEAIAERTGTDTARDLYPTLAAAAAVSALRATIEFWPSASSTPPSLRDLLRQAPPAESGLPPAST